MGACRGGRWFGGKGGAGCKARGLPGGWAAEPRATRVSAASAVTLTIEMHSVPIGRRQRMSTMPRPSADRARALTVGLHSVSSGVGGGISTSGSAMRGARASMLTVEIHSAASGFRLRISTSENRAFRRSSVCAHRSNTQGRGWIGRTNILAGTRLPCDCRLALTAEIHRGSTGCDDSRPRPELRCLAAMRAPSPLKTTALRVIGRVRYPRLNMQAARLPTHSHH